MIYFLFLKLKSYRKFLHTYWKTIMPENLKFSDKYILGVNIGTTILYIYIRW